MIASGMGRLGRSMAKHKEQRKVCACSPPRQTLDGFCPYLFVHSEAAVRAEGKPTLNSRFSPEPHLRGAQIEKTLKLRYTPGEPRCKPALLTNVSQTAQSITDNDLVVRSVISRVGSFETLTRNQ